MKELTMKREIDFGDYRCTCECCRADTPAQSTEAMQLAWVSTMAFVAMGVSDEGDADSGVSYCPVCAERFIGPKWHAIGTWKAKKYKASIQWECMMTGVPDYGTLH